MAGHPSWHPAVPFLAGGLFLAAALVLGAPVPTRAQDGAPDEVAQPSEAELTLARERFGRGLELSDQGQWREAVTLFRQVLQVRSAPPVLFNLATALVELEEYDEAEELLASVVADDATQPRIRVRSERLLERMSEDGAELTITLAGATSGVFVTLDERELAAERVEGPVRVSAGSHVVAAERDGDEVARREVELAAGAAESVVLEIAEPADEPSEIPELALTADAPSDESSGQGMSWQLWAGVGGGVAALLIVVVAVSVASGGGGGDAFVGDFTPSTLVWR